MKSNKTSLTRAALMLFVLLLAATSAWAAMPDYIGSTLKLNQSTGYYQIATPQNLIDLANYVNAGGETCVHNGNACSQPYRFRLMNNITISNSTYGAFPPIGSRNNEFEGKFDGKENTITIEKFDVSGKNVTVNSKNYIDIGLFGAIGKVGYVYKLTVVIPQTTEYSNTNIKFTEMSFGGIAGFNKGEIESCTVKAASSGSTVKLSASYTNTDVIKVVGGLVGRNDSVVVYGKFSGKLAETGNSYGYTEVGGIVGGNYGELKQSAPASGSTITTSYADYTGGVVGYNGDGLVQYCEITGCTVAASSGSAGGLAGYAGFSSTKYNYVENCSISGTYTGAIVGEANNNSYTTFNGNSYYGITINGTRKYSGVGVGKTTGQSTSPSDLTTKNGATPVAKATTSDKNISISSATSNQETHSNTTYYIYGATIYLKYSGSTTGYTASFTAKTIDNQSVSINQNTGTFTIQGKDVTVSATKTPINYTITYKLNGGSNPSGAATSYNITSNAITLPNPTRNGFTFGGWYTDANFTSTKVTSIAKGSTGNKTFFAKWTANSYTITYKLNNGTNPSGAPTSYTAASADITLPTPTKTGYSFDGWYTSDTFSGTKVTTIPTGSYNNKTFYAKWTPITYTVQFNANNSTDETTTQQFTYDTAKELKANTFTPATDKGGFLKWTTNADGTGTSYADGESITNLTSTLGETIQLYAQWKKHIAYTNDFYIRDIEDQEYEGYPLQPPVLIVYNNVSVTNDFIITYSNNLNVGKASVTYTIDSKKFPEYDGSVTKYFNIRKATPRVEAPTANELTYNGESQALITAGSTKDGYILYSLDGETYSEKVPTAVDAGKYTVYYMVDYEVFERDNYESFSDKIDVEIAKATPTITAPVANELAYNGEVQTLVTAGSANSGTMLYSLDGESFSEEIPTAVNAGDYTVYYKVEGTNNYEGVVSSVTATIPGTYTKNEFVEINEIDGKKYVTIDGDGESNKHFEIKEDIVVENVKLTREFTFGSGYSTLVLPFEVNTKQLTGVSKILEFTGMGVNDKGVKQVEMSVLWDKDKPHVKIEANKPYMIQMESATLGVDGEVTLKKTVTPIATVPNSDWKFVGTYQYKKWESGDPQLGHAYGFAGTPKGELSAGEFVKVGVGTYINPMRAYLLAPTFSGLKKASYVSSTASIENSFPDSIEVVVVDKEHTTVIGTFSTVTGQFKMNCNYDLKGRNLQGKSKARGAYYGRIELKK